MNKYRPVFADAERLKTVYGSVLPGQADAWREEVMLAAEATKPFDLAAFREGHQTPLYWGAALWSLWRCGDHWSRNVFEQRAGLVEGGYVENPVRRLRGRTQASGS